MASPPTSSDAEALLDYVDRAYLINLPSRTDRRRDMFNELRPVFGDTLVQEKVAIYPAKRPADAGPFVNVGTHGCFLSHLGVLKVALHAGHERVLIFEDDASFRTHARTHLKMLTEQLDGQDWDYAHFGYNDVFGSIDAAGNDSARFLQINTEIQGAQFYAVNGKALAPLIAHLETCLTGVPGDDIRGPMPVDGAFNTFEWTHDVVRLAAVPSQATQRSSRSDISPQRLDQIKLLAPVLSAARALRRSRNTVR